MSRCSYITQTSYYKKSPVELSYSVSAGIAGLIAGPLLFAPLASVIGCSSLIFWSTLGTLACNIWGPLMTASNDYIPFVLSRLVAGLFGSIPGILASRYIMNMYFLHQRGKAFAALEVALFAGLLVAPVLGGFIADSRPWPYVFWWLVAVTGVSAITSKCLSLGLLGLDLTSPTDLLFLQETSFDREADVETRYRKSFAVNRIATLLPGSAVVPKTTYQDLVRNHSPPLIPECRGSCPQLTKA